jgi:hypothetical protein
MSGVYDPLQAYQLLWHVSRHSGVASLVGENRDQEVKEFSELLKKVAADPDRFVQELRTTNWYECKSYANSVWLSYVQSNSSQGLIGRSGLFRKWLRIDGFTSG